MREAKKDTRGRKDVQKQNRDRRGESEAPKVMNVIQTCTIFAKHVAFARCRTDGAAWRRQLFPHLR